MIRIMRLNNMSIENLKLRLHPRIYKMDAQSDCILYFISFVNAVNFYRKELLKLRETFIAKNIFNDTEQRNLMKHMLFFPYNVKSKTCNYGTVSYPTCLANMILTGMIKVNHEELVKELDKMIIIKNKYVHTCNVERGYCFHCYLVGSLCELYYRKGGTIILKNNGVMI